MRQGLFLGSAGAELCMSRCQGHGALSFFSLRLVELNGLGTTDLSVYTV